MLNQHIVDRSRYGHHGLRSGGRPARPTNRIDGSYTGPGVPVTVSPDRPEPPNTRNQTHALSGWGEAPLVIEPFVDAHVHLDYSNTVGRPRPNESGTLFEAIEIWAERKEKGLNDFGEIYGNALAAARSEAANGTGFIRSHVDVTDPDLTALKAILQLREDVKDWIEIQIVAFPQNTVLSFRDGPQLLEQALEMGANVIGGIPHNEGTPEDGVASLRIIFDLAEKYGVPIDVHCDEIDDEQSRFVEVMAAFASKTKARRPRDG